MDILLVVVFGITYDVVSGFAITNDYITTVDTRPDVVLHNPPAQSISDTAGRNKASYHNKDKVVKSYK
jgi:hypothetical protein